jgi:Domain of unknown function (DUF4365)
MQYDQPEKDEPTIGENFSTGHQAELFLEAILPPPRWLPRRQTHDVFVDFHVEVVEQGHLSGFEFGVQVKGTKRKKKSAVKTQMKCKHLRYYRDKARLPVFVVLVDLVGKRAHWLFAQRYLRECENNSAVDKQKTFTLTFDPADSFSDLERFRGALKNADRYMRELYPGSPAAAVSAKEAELQQLDPDIGVKVSFEDGEILHFNPKKPLHCTFQGLNAEGFKSFQAMLNHGDDFEASVEVIPPDSPLFKKLMTGKNGYIQFKPDRPDGCLQIICASTQEVIQIEGKWRVGRQSIRFEGRLEKSPLQVELRIDDWLEDGKAKVSFDSPISLIEWEGQSVLRLASFDQIRSLVLALADRDELTIKYFLNGTNVGCLAAVADKNKPMNTPMKRVGSAVNWLAKVRQVAVHYGVDAMLPKWKDITRKMEDTVEALDALAKNKAREEQISGAQFKILASPHLKFPDDNSSAVLGTMKVTGCVTFDFFGREITVSNVEQVLANMRLLSTTATPTAKEFVFEGQEGAVLIRRKIAA